MRRPRRHFQSQGPVAGALWRVLRARLLPFGTCVLLATAALRRSRCFTAAGALCRRAAELAAPGTSPAAPDGGTRSCCAPPAPTRPASPRATPRAAAALALRHRAARARRHRGVGPFRPRRRADHRERCIGASIPRSRTRPASSACIKEETAPHADLRAAARRLHRACRARPRERRQARAGAHRYGPRSVRSAGRRSALRRPRRRQPDRRRADRLSRSIPAASSTAATSARWPPTFRPAISCSCRKGTYHVVSNYGDGNAVMRYDIRVQAGKLTDARINHRAAAITLKLVGETGGEAIANTAWSVLTPGGDVIKESIGAFPRSFSPRAITSPSRATRAKSSIANSRSSRRRPRDRVVGALVWWFEVASLPPQLVERTSESNHTTIRSASVLRIRSRSRTSRRMKRTSDSGY